MFWSNEFQSASAGKIEYIVFQSHLKMQWDFSVATEDRGIGKSEHKQMCGGLIQKYSSPWI